MIVPPPEATLNSTTTPDTGFANASSARIDGGSATLVFTVAVCVLGLWRTRLATGPGAACAVNVITGTPSAEAVSVCVPATVPRLHPPDNATPVPSVRVESDMTTPLLAPTRQRTRNPLMPCPFASRICTRGSGVVSAPTVPLTCSVLPPVGAKVVGTGGPSPPPHACIANATAVPQTSRPTKAIVLDRSIPVRVEGKNT